MNIYYIKAAIKENTGKDLSIREVADYLVSENMIKKEHVEVLIFKGYNDLYDTETAEGRKYSTKAVEQILRSINE